MSFFGKFYFSSSHDFDVSAEATMKELLRLRRESKTESWQPPTDIIETAEGIVVLMELAGVAPHEVQVYISDEVLTVRGQRREICPFCKKGYRQMEIYHGLFERVLILPGPVSEKGYAAHFENGMLSLFLPRAEKHHPNATAVMLKVDVEKK